MIGRCNVRLPLEDLVARGGRCLDAVAAARAKKAEDVVALDVSKLCSFTDYFIICSGSNPRQVQAVADEVELRLKKQNVHAHHIEGYSQAEWVLMDYFDFIIHVFTPSTREFYSLERLWGDAERKALILEGKTDGDGTFRLPNLTRGTYFLEFLAPGFHSYLTEVRVSNVSFATGFVFSPLLSGAGRQLRD